MEAITYLAALSLALSGGPARGPAPAALLGTWRVQLPQEVRDVAKKMGMPEPQSQFVFNADKTFTYSASNGGTAKSLNGTWDINGHDIKLLALNNDGMWPSSGQVGQFKEGEKELDVNGLKYAKDGDAPASAASVPPITIVGKWVLSDDPGTHMVFKENGCFEFEGSGASSKGKYSTDGSQITITWTEVDGEKVSGSMHKTLCYVNGAIQLDTYRYVKK